MTKFLRFVRRQRVRYATGAKDLGHALRGVEDRVQVVMVFVVVRIVG